MDRKAPLSNGEFHEGVYYAEYLRQIHEVCKPSSYLEIGVGAGRTLAFAQCPAIAIDPNFQLREIVFGQRIETYLFQLKSDDFFAQFNLNAFLPGGVDFAFLDGMHHFEYLLRDLMNTEKYSHEDTIVALHDCYPVNTEMANREPNFHRRVDTTRRLWWTGDVWKLLPILRDYRPGLDVTILDCPPTGLIVVRGLDPGSKALSDAFDEIIAKYRDINLENFRIERFRKEFQTTDSRAVFQPDMLRKRFRRPAT